MENALYDIKIPELKKLYSGKVRELFELDAGRMLMVATDRISVFDHVLPTPIPEKGAILTKMSVYWFQKLNDTMRNHMIEHDFSRFPDVLRGHDFLKDRSIIVRKVDRIPVECVVRGYLSGSGWKEYGENGKVCGIELPKGLKESEKLPEPIFTPATKEEKGVHDINIDFAEMENRVGQEIARLVRDKSLSLYSHASAIAEEKGIIIADTKFEFGIYENNLILIDEVFTPDSSRFWEKERYVAGRSPESLDKQYIRDYLLTTDWDRNSPPPSLPEEVVNMTVSKYKQIYSILTA